MKASALAFLKSLASSFRDRAPIIVVVAFFQLAVLQHSIPNIADILVGALLVAIGLSLETQRDMLMFLVEEHLSRRILEKIANVAEFDKEPGAGIAFQINVEDAVGVSHQVRKLTKFVEDVL